MNFKRLVLSAAATAAVVFAVIQFVPVYARTNPTVSPEKSIAANLSMPPRIVNIVGKACMDCHSNETRWPWYSKVAPMSWLVVRDVENARQDLNLSEWSDHEGKKKGTAIGALTAACQGVKDKKMPLPQYQTMHSEARLSDEEIQYFCTWTVVAAHQLKSAHGVTEHSAK